MKFCAITLRQSVPVRVKLRAHSCCFSRKEQKQYIVRNAVVGIDLGALHVAMHMYELAIKV